MRSVLQAILFCGLFAGGALAKTIDHGVHGAQPVMRDAAFNITLASGETQEVHLVYSMLVDWRVVDDRDIEPFEQRFTCSFEGHARALYRTARIDSSPAGMPELVMSFPAPPDREFNVPCGQELGGDLTRLALRYAGDPAQYRAYIDADSRGYLDRLREASEPKLRLQRVR